MKVDLYSEVNKPLVELILGMPIDDSNKEQVEVEMGTKMFLFERQLTKLIDEQEGKYNQSLFQLELLKGGRNRNIRRRAKAWGGGWGSISDDDYY